MAAIDGYRVRVEKAGRNINRVIAVYEAEWSGFWLARVPKARLRPLRHRTVRWARDFFFCQYNALRKTLTFWR